MTAKHIFHYRIVIFIRAHREQSDNRSRVILNKIYQNNLLLVRAGGSGRLLKGHVVLVELAGSVCHLQVEHSHGLGVLKASPTTSYVADVMGKLRAI